MQNDYIPYGWKVKTFYTIHELQRTLNTMWLDSSRLRTSPTSLNNIKGLCIKNDDIRWIAIIKSAHKDEASIQKTLLHESQHAIQYDLFEAYGLDENIFYYTSQYYLEEDAKNFSNNPDTYDRYASAIDAIVDTVYHYIRGEE